MGLSVQTFKVTTEELKLKMAEGKPREECTAEEIQARKDHWAVSNGFTWRAAIVDDNDTVLFVAPQFCLERSHAYRKGKRYLERYRITGGFAESVALAKTAHANLSAENSGYPSAED